MESGDLGPQETMTPSTGPRVALSLGSVDIWEPGDPWCDFCAVLALQTLGPGLKAALPRLPGSGLLSGSSCSLLRGVS